ncbi:MAG: hypothetical protein ACYCWK_09390 [Cuniculiplasma sp.]|jgi:hypothetical protein
MRVARKKFVFRASHSAPAKEKSLDDKINEGHFYIGQPKDWNKHVGR